MNTEGSYFRSTPPPAPPPGEPSETPTLPLPPPRSQEHLHEFVSMIGCTSSGEREWIIEAVEGLRDDEQVLDLIQTALDARPVHEMGWTMTLLSITGQLRNERSLEALSRLMWASTQELLSLDERVDGGCVFDPSGIIQARAVEMFAWIAATSRDEDVLAVVAEHPDRAARLAAADAYLYHHRDADEALRQVRAVARAEDRDSAGAPRFVRTDDAGEFDKALLAKLEEVPVPDVAGDRRYDADV